MRRSFAALALFFCAHVHAGLRWETNLIRRVTRPGTERIEGRFPFANVGNNPVTIQKINSSCGCTTAQLAQKTFAPGEKGELVAVFSPGDRTGEQMKTVRVQTDDGESMLLGLKVQIEETVELDRTVLLWRKGDPPTPQAVTLTARREAPLALARQQPETPGLRVEIEPVKPGRVFRIQIAPESTAEGLSAKVRIVFENADEYGADTLLRVRVK